MLEELRQQLVETLKAEPALKAEIVQLVCAIERRIGAPRTFPSRQERRESRYEDAGYHKESKFR